jgi:hypothetical protein
MGTPTPPLHTLQWEEKKKWKSQKTNLEKKNALALDIPISSTIIVAKHYWKTASKKDF